MRVRSAICSAGRSGHMRRDLVPIRREVSANETDHSARLSTHIELACSPDFMWSTPGLEANEALMMQANEMGPHFGRSGEASIAGDAGSKGSSPPGCAASMAASRLDSGVDSIAKRAAH